MNRGATHGATHNRRTCTLKELPVVSEFRFDFSIHVDRGQLKPRHHWAVDTTAVQCLQRKERGWKVSAIFGAFSNHVQQPRSATTTVFHCSPLFCCSPLFRLPPTCSPTFWCRWCQNHRASFASTCPRPAARNACCATEWRSAG